MASSFLRFLDHTQWRTTVSRTHLDKWSARCRDLYLTTHNTHNRQKSMPPVGFKPLISAGERPQNYALNRVATGTGTIIDMVLLNNLQLNWPMVTKQELACHEGPVGPNLAAQSWQSSTQCAQLEICQHVSYCTLSFQEDYMGLAESPTSWRTERKNSHCLIVWMKMSRLSNLKSQASLDVTSHRLVYTSYQRFGITCSLRNYGSLQWAACTYNSGRTITFPYLNHTLSPCICHACHPSPPFFSCSSNGPPHSTKPPLNGLLL